MPTKEDIDELVANTDKEWTSFDGCIGMRFSNRKDASKYIFLPCSGYFDGLELKYHEGSNAENARGYYWSSSLSTMSSDPDRGRALRFYPIREGSQPEIYHEAISTDGFRYLGFQVRAVQDK